MLNESTINVTTSLLPEYTLFTGLIEDHINNYTVGRGARLRGALAGRGVWLVTREDYTCK